MIVNLVTGLFSYGGRAIDEPDRLGGAYRRVPRRVLLDLAVRPKALADCADVPTADRQEDFDDKPAVRLTVSEAFACCQVRSDGFCRPWRLSPGDLHSSARLRQATGRVDDFVGRINATVGSLKPGDAAGARSACARLVDQAFDIDAMAPATSAGAWQRMSAAQKTAYRSGLASALPATACRAAATLPARRWNSSACARARAATVSSR